METGVPTGIKLFDLKANAVAEMSSRGAAYQYGDALLSPVNTKRSWQHSKLRLVL
jgi:hypothetical protein